MQPQTTLFKTTSDNTYEQFYQSLKGIRDLFHKSGRFDDSNTKLDEITKLIVLYLYQLEQCLNVNLKDLLFEYEHNPAYSIALELKQAFGTLLTDKMLLNADGTSIFGSAPQLAIQDNDNEFAYQLLKLVTETIDSLNGDKGANIQFDLLNEAFGHFVRDNFRNNIEDAQYMTPPEVVEFMSQVALYDIVCEENPSGEYIVVDPCCGVGSFLSSFYKLAKAHPHFEHCTVKVYGQDKVDRMVRLSKINLMLFNTKDHLITAGNSLVGASTLTDLDSKVDLILTNPPFGARFSSHEIYVQSANRYPLLHDLARTNGKNFTSELLFIDRCLALLKPGGRLLAVVPDSVISSRGLAATLRQRLAQHADIKMIAGLPTVTFAQAGTRTKTHILYIQKHISSARSRQSPIFMAHSADIGFEVKSRKGSPVKVISGTNDLPLILNAYKKARSSEPINRANGYQVIVTTPSCVQVESNTVLKGSWTPNHYNAARYNAIIELTDNAKQDIELVPLKDIANFITTTRRRDIVSEDSKCISVLHVVGEGVIDYGEFFSYAPKYPGIPCRPGDLLFSKINPRIPRALVAPDLGVPLTCSTEFEIMDSKTDIDNYAIMMLLLLPTVQEQIKHLTSGTSSSHNRIKTSQLSKVLVPLPKTGTAAFDNFAILAQQYKEHINSLNTTYLNLLHLKPEINQLLNTEL